MADYIGWLTTQTIQNGTADEAIALMEHLRAEAARLDRIIADPRHVWNRVYGGDVVPFSSAAGAQTGALRD